MLIPAERVKTANLSKPKFPSASFYELTQRKARRIKCFRGVINVYLKICLRPKNFNSSRESKNSHPNLT